MAQKFKNQIDAQEGIKITNELYDGSNAAGTSGQVLSSTGTGTQWVDFSADTAERTEILVKNVEGSSLVKGDPVYIVGGVGASARLEVGLCDASDSSKMPCVGLLSQNLANNGEGLAIVTGKLRNLITSPIDGVTPTENDTIYVKPGGSSGAALTTTKPTATNHLIQNVGQVGLVSTTASGNLVVSAIMRTNDVPNLVDRTITFDSFVDVAEYIRHSGDNDTYIRFLDDRLDLRAGNLSFIDLREGASPIGYFNVSNNDIDLQVRGTTNNNLIRTNAGTDRVGIGGTPDYNFDVKLGTDNTMRVKSDDDTTQIMMSDDDTTAYLGVRNSTMYMSFTGGTQTDGFYIDSSGNGTFAGGITASGDLLLDDGTTESPHIILKDDDDVEFRIYNADSNTFHITRSGNSGADFVINANATDYTQSTFLFAGATLSAATIGNWNTAYNDHITGISFNTSNGELTLTQNDAGTLVEDLDGRYAIFRSNVLTLSNGEIANLSAAYQMTIDANDTDSDITTLGDYSGGYPFGIYFLGDGGNTGTTLGTGLVKVWNTGHFAKQNILNWESAYGDKINSASFNTSNGELTLTRQDAGTVVVDLDGRYLELTGGTLTGNLEIQNSGRPTLTLDDNGNAGGGGAEGVILFKNNDGNAIGIGYTADNTSSSDLIISTDAGSTYGGYLDLSAAAISDTQADIILDPKSKVLVTKDLTIDGGDLTIAKQNDAPTMTLLHDGTNPSTNDLLFKMQFQSDYDGSHQNWGKIELNTNVSSVRTEMDFYVKSTSGNEELGLRIEGNNDKPKTYIYGDLIVEGDTTTLNTQTVEVEDNILQLNTTQGSPDTATATTSGISIYRGDGITQASFIFDDADDTWDLTHNLELPTANSTFTLYGLLFRDSTDRSGLLELVRKGTTSWTGYQATFGSQHWSWMGNASDVGLYDDTNGKWAYLYNINGSLELRYDGTTKIETTSTGADVFGDLEIIKSSTHTAQGSFSGGNAHLDLYNNLEADTDQKGSIITFTDNYYDGSSYIKTTRAGIKGGTDTTGNTADGYLEFYTDSGSANSPTLALRIDRNQNSTFAGTVTAATSFISDAIGTSNNDPGDGNAQFNGYGIIGHRGAFYITNAETDSGATVQIGIGGIHNAAPKLVVGTTNSTFYTNVQPQADSTYDLGSTTLRWANIYADNLYGIVDKLEITSNDSFNGTYSLLWHDGSNNVYSSSFMTINGTTDTLSVPNISTTGDVTVGGDISAGTFAWDNTNSRLGVNVSSPSHKLHVSSGNGDTNNTVLISHTRNDANVGTHALQIDANFSGADTTTADRTNSAIFIDLDSSADGDAADEVRSYGVYVDARITGYNDVLRGVYSIVESNNVTEKTAEIVGVYGHATHDSSSTNGGVSNMYGVRGVAAIQDYGDVDNSYGVHGLIQIADNRNANVDAVNALFGEIQIDEATALSYGNMYGCRVVIDNNEGSVPTFSNQYLFFGDYQGTKATGAYGIYVEGDRHYFAGNLGIQNTNPTSKLSVGGNTISTLIPTAAIVDTTDGASLTLRGQSPILYFDVTNSGTGKILMDAAGIEFKNGTLDSEGSVHLKIDTSGNVGINESSIDAKLHLTTASAGLVNQKFESAGSAAWRLGIPASQTYFAFDNANDDLSAPKMVIDSNGNLCINTTSSSDGDLAINDPKLHVQGPTSSGAYHLVSRFQAGNDADNTGAAIAINHSNDRGLLIKAGRKDSDREVAYFDLISSGGNKTNLLTLGKYGSDYYSLFKGGNVGIGNFDSPNTLLHIYDGAASGSATTDLLKLEAYTGDFGATPAAIALAFKFQDSNNLTNEARIRMATVNDTDYGDNDEAASNLIFSTTNAGVESDKMIITGRGDIGINVINPDYKLDVGGAIGLSGRLHVDTVGDEYKIGADDYTTDQTSGLMVRPADNVNPTDGDALFVVRSGGGSPRLFVEHSGTTGTTNSTFTVGATATRGNGNVVLSSTGTSSLSGGGLSITGNLTFADGAARSIIGPTNQSLIINSKPNAATEGTIFQINGDDKLSLLNDGNATFAGEVTATEYNLPSGGMLDWANGDARIIEGLVNNYSLSFQTYDGSSVTTALRLDGDNTATFASNIDFSTNGSDISMKDSAGALTRVLVLNSSNVTYIGPVDSYAGGSSIYGASSNHGNHDLYVGGARVLRVQSSGIDVDGTGAFENTVTIDAPDEGSAPAMTATLNMRGYEGRGVGIKIRDSQNSASNPSAREWFIGSGYAQSGFNIGYASDGSQSSYAAQAKFTIATSGEAFFAGRVYISDNLDLNLWDSNGSGSAGKIHLPRAGAITFYGDESKNHSIMSVNASGTTADDIRINSYGAVTINLDSNNNNTANADFKIGKHGSHSSGITDIFVINGETGNADFYTNGVGGVSIHGSGTGEGGHLTLKKASSYTYQWCIDNYQDNLRFFRENDDGTGGTVYANIASDGDLQIARYLEHYGDTNSYLGWSAADDFRIYVGGRELVRLDEGTDPDIAKFMTDEFRMYSDGTFHADGDIIAYSTTASSDKRLKKNIKPIDNALDIVDKLQGVHFNWKKDDKKSIGYIAQDVEKVLPEMVKEQNHFNDGSYKTVNYAAMVSVMGEAIKELRAEVEELKKQINGSTRIG